MLANKETNKRTCTPSVSGKQRQREVTRLNCSINIMGNRILKQKTSKHISRILQNLYGEMSKEAVVPVNISFVVILIHRAGDD